MKSLLLLRVERGWTKAELTIKTGIPMKRLFELENRLQVPTETEKNKIGILFNEPVLWAASHEEARANREAFLKKSEKKMPSMRLDSQPLGK